jgi:hypothetical protein
MPEGGMALTTLFKCRSAFQAGMHFWLRFME